MKVSLVTPVDIRYSYKATEYLVYEYAKFLKSNGIDTEILITKGKDGGSQIANYSQVKKRYREIPKRKVDCAEMVLPFKYHLFFYDGLPQDSVMYLPFSIYDYIPNILTKPAGQKYIIGSHGMHLKMGHIVKNHSMLEKTLNAMVRNALRINRKEIDNLYCHVINKEQQEYVRKTFGFRPENILYVPIMIKAKDYHPERNNSRKLRILHVGGIGKDMQIVLEVIDMLNAMKKLSMFEFYFIGEEDNESKRRYAHLNNVHFLGMVGDREKIKTMGQCDVIIVPAYETFSKTMLEGLVSGLYVLTSKRTGSWKDITDLGIKINVANHGKAEEYMEPLIHLAGLKSKGKVINMHKAINIKKTEENFDESVILKKMLELFLKVIE